jgi:hypothetical protein
MIECDVDIGNLYDTTMAPPLDINVYLFLPVFTDIVCFMKLIMGF